MKQRPILFSTAMVQAILEGRKTQTRRVVKPKHEPTPHPFGLGVFFVNLEACPYGQPGDILWVRETWAPALGEYAYKSDYSESTLLEPRNKGIWKPSIHMPREACRLFLRIKSVRLERLQDIRQEDAVAEGINTEYPSETTPWLHEWKDYLGGKWDLDAFGSFASLWQSINGPESWEANPWVWVIEFERVERP